MNDEQAAESAAFCHQFNDEDIDMKYRKRPVVVDAVQWRGDNFEEVVALSDDESCVGYHPLDSGDLYITTLEGLMTAIKSDYIIKGISNEIYPCEEHIFNATYEPIEEPKWTPCENFC